MDVLFLQYSWDKLLAVINSQFFSSLIGALAGAFAGAMAAHRISESAKDRDDLAAQIRGTNAAIMSSFIICNALLALKRQEVAEIYKEFSKKREEYRNVLKMNQPNTSFHLEADLRFIQVPAVPMEILSKQAYEKLSLRGRPLALVSAISNALSSLKDAISVRDSIIQQFKNLPPTFNEKARADFYFGFSLPDGNLNTEYADSLEGIHRYTDDIIFFSSRLCLDLEEYGNTARNQYLKKHKRKVEEISSPEFEKAIALNLMPDQKEYEDWLSAFGMISEEKRKPWYRRLWG